MPVSGRASRQRSWALTVEEACGGGVRRYRIEELIYKLRASVKNVQR